tara:strand:+ start:3740 stop:4924 length:1185 start_codon:yes stop_codon:yes gene_type:complete
MKKILFLSYNDIGGGAGIAAYKFFNLLRKNKNYDADFYCIKKYSKNPKVKIIKINLLSYLKIFINIMLARILFIIFPIKNYQKRSLCLFDTGILKNIDLNKYDLVHFHWFFNEIISLDEILNIPKKLLISTHDLWFINGSTHFNSNAKDHNFLTRKFENYLKIKKIKKIKKKKDIIFTTPGRWSNNFYNNLLINKIILLPNVPNLINSSINKSIKEKLFIPKKIILTSINLNRKNEYVKGYDILKKILFKLDKLNETFYFVVYGTGTNILPYSLYKNLIFYDFKNVDFFKMSEIYSISDITLLPSRQETYSQVVSESINLDIPVVIFDNSAPKEQVDHKLNGYIANSFDVNDFIKGYLYFCNKKKLKMNKKQNKLNQIKLIVNLSKIYDQLLSK